MTGQKSRLGSTPSLSATTRSFTGLRSSPSCKYRRQSTVNHAQCFETYWDDASISRLVSKEPEDVLELPVADVWHVLQCEHPVIVALKLGHFLQEIRWDRHVLKFPHVNKIDALLQLCLLLLHQLLLARECLLKSLNVLLQRLQLKLVFDQLIKHFLLIFGHKRGLGGVVAALLALLLLLMIGQLESLALNDDSIDLLEIHLVCIWGL